MVLNGEHADNNSNDSDLETERERAINDLSMEACLRRLREENDIAEPEEKVEAEPEAKVEEESEEDDLESVATEADKKVVSDEEFVTPTGPFIGGICPNPDCQARGMAGMPCIACHEGRILRPLTQEERTPQFPGRCLQCGKIGKFGDDCENPNCQYGTYSVPEVPDSEQPSPEESNTSSQDYSHCEDSPGDTTSSNESDDSDNIRDISGKHEVNSVGTEPTRCDEWLIDSGASVHVTNEKDDLLEPKSTGQAVTIRSGTTMAAKAIGGKPTKLKDDQGNVIELADVLYIPDFKKKIISLSKLLDQGYHVPEWTKEYFWLSKDGKAIQVPRKEGFTMYYFRAMPQTWEVHATERTMDINEAHDKMAHMGEDIVRKTMARYGIKLTGKLEPCDACLRAKACAKNLSKKTECMATKPGERLCMDLTGPFPLSLGGSRYDAKIVDQFSRKSWGGHLRTKDQVYDILKKHLEYLKGKGMTMQYLRCDNASEQGTKLADLCKSYGITMEYTAPNTPQQNGIVEQKIAMDCDRANAMLLAA